MKGSVITLIAFVGPFLNVLLHMTLQTSNSKGCIVALAALVSFAIGVDFYMLLKIPDLIRRKITYLAFILPISNVILHMMF